MRATMGVVMEWKVFVGVVTVLAAGLVQMRSAVGSQTLAEITIFVPGIPGPYCMYGIEKRLPPSPRSRTCGWTGPRRRSASS
jgi:hypothetical protein